VRKLLVGAYPRAWRERYGDELLALLKQLPLTPATVLNLLGGALAAHWQERDAWAAAVRHASRGQVLWWVGSSFAVGGFAFYVFVPELVSSAFLVRRLHVAVLLLLVLLAIISKLADGPQWGRRSARTQLAGSLVAMVWTLYLTAWNPWGPRGPGATPQWIQRASYALFAVAWAVGVVIQLRRAIRRSGSGYSTGR
jgi:hypothetical protein